MSLEIIRKNWKSKEDKIINKNDFLNGMEFDDVSDIQQMLYLTYKKIEQLEQEIIKLKEVKNGKIK